MNYWFAFSYCI